MTRTPEMTRETAAGSIRGTLQIADAAALARLLVIRTGDEDISLEKLARMEIASRGLGKDLTWVGFDKAWAAWGLTEDDKVINQKIEATR